MKKKIVRITTVPSSISGLLKGQLKFMSNYYDILGVSSEGENNLLENFGIDQGIRVHKIEMTRKISPISDLKALYLLYKLLKKEKPFIVHSHTPKAGTIGMLAAKLANVPHRLHTIAGLPLLEATGFKRYILDTVEKITYSCATQIFPNSYGLKKIIIESKFTTENKLKVIANGSSNGIDTKHFNPELYENNSKTRIREELGFNNEDFIFVFAGRMVKDKGVNELIKAFEKISNEFKHTKLLLMGDYERDLDPLLPQTEEIIETNKNIKFIGFIKDIRPYFSASDVLAFPTYREGFPNVVMQACAMNLASIVTDINGCNEIIEHNYNGIIIPPKDEQALYEAMKFMLNNPEKRKEMAQVSRSKIVDNYEQEVVWKALLKEYDKLN
ncbi:glycosyltransferase family 4 protein [Flavobacteriaceae bacterium XHP0103]|uniref:glycosyltransferase family 4 protein n=1 Tax=Marixanthotalea marina TaxID=2844359 RepID=UPI002989FF35|nr:glycosyltransferase family 4 protein [Marixanthotalea marina]MBU3822291.1 glycosyltransferase family 4 protein [Marixanthotalea marina]